MNPCHFVSRPFPRDSSKGFTLLEVMVTVAIIAGVVALVLPRINTKGNKAKTHLRKLATISKELHTRAKLNGSVYRLVIDMKDGPNSDENHSYWVERSNQKTLISEKELQEMEALRKEGKLEKDKDGKPKPIPGGFEPDTQILKAVQELPSGLKFNEVEKANSEKPIISGRAYVHFFPQGLVEEAAIHLKISDTNQWTISIEPLSGKTEVVSSYVKLSELRNQE